MNNDKELLELAAKAAGMMNYAYFGSNMYEEAVHGVPHCGGIGQAWNPITDDGDALRLAVKLKIDFYEGAGDSPEAWAGYYLPGFTKQKFACVPHGNDPYAATRLAIVRAAAEIGSLHNAAISGAKHPID